jgi:uncharacterized membrane protein YphA (DoxX/SURF4 family)
MAQGAMSGSIELSGWKTFAAWTGAILSAALFLVAGLWKITDLPATAVYMTQALVPGNLSLAAAFALGITETFAGILILVPRFRRWGAAIISLLLVAFMIYVALYYDGLRGAECKCFPWVKRAFGPWFFVSDGAMLALSGLAWIWSKPSSGTRGAALVLCAVTVGAAASYGVAMTRESGAAAPDAITVDGKPFPLRDGKVLIYFFDPECTHCIDAAKRMSAMNFGETRLVGVATAQPQFAPEFLRMTGFRAGISPDVELLKRTFPFTSTPAAVAIENGRQKALLSAFDGEEPLATLKNIGFVY